MVKKLSEDLKWRIIYCYEEGFKPKEIAERLYVSKTAVTKVCKIFNKWGCVDDPFIGRSGKGKIFTSRDMQLLQEIVQEKVDYYLDELIYEMERKTGKLVSIPTLWRSLQYCGITRKKIQKAAYERNETLRGYFMYQIGIEYNAEQLIFVDETSKDERSVSRLYGYSYKNSRAKKKVVFVRGKRYTILPALTIDGFIAADIMEGSCDKDRFQTFILTQVLPQMNPYPGKNSVLIMDNARIHHDEDLIKSIEEFGCRVIYLPPYSPDLNPIETAFSALKSWLKRYRDVVNNCDDPIYILFVALSQTTPNMARQYFQQSIYM